jgi:hypothetical protein
MGHVSCIEGESSVAKGKSQGTTLYENCARRGPVNPACKFCINGLYCLRKMIRGSRGFTWSILAALR